MTIAPGGAGLAPLVLYSAATSTVRARPCQSVPVRVSLPEPRGRPPGLPGWRPWAPSPLHRWGREVAAPERTSRVIASVVKELPSGQPGPDVQVRSGTSLEFIVIPASRIRIPEIQG